MNLQNPPKKTKSATALGESFLAFIAVFAFQIFLFKKFWPSDGLFAGPHADYMALGGLLASFVGYYFGLDISKLLAAGSPTSRIVVGLTIATLATVAGFSIIVFTAAIAQIGRLH